MADPVVPQQIWDPNLKRFINVDTHDASAGADLLSQERLQSALGLGGNQNVSSEPEPNLKDYMAKYGMGGSNKWRADHDAWQSRIGAKKPILARPSPTQNAPQPNPTAQPTHPIAGLIQQMLGMNQQNG